jgi:hypothetical protein
MKELILLHFAHHCTLRHLSPSVHSAHLLHGFGALVNPIDSTVELRIELSRGRRFGCRRDRPSYCGSLLRKLDTISLLELSSIETRISRAVFGQVVVTSQVQKRSRVITGPLTEKHNKPRNVVGPLEATMANETPWDTAVVPSFHATT